MKNIRLNTLINSDYARYFDYPEFILKEDLKNLKVILTHSHWDHIGDIFNLGYDSISSVTVNVFENHHDFSSTHNASL